MYDIHNMVHDDAIRVIYCPLNLKLIITIKEKANFEGDDGPVETVIPSLNNNHFKTVCTK